MNVITNAELSSERLLSRKEVEEIFGFPTKRYLEIAAMGEEGPPIVRFGRTVRHRVSDLRTWIEAHRSDDCRDCGSEHDQ